MNFVKFLVTPISIEHLQTTTSEKFLWDASEHKIPSVCMSRGIQPGANMKCGYIHFYILVYK